ncbi:MAG: exodeoxyribonuclease III, partial [Woeseiaceae bacterium]
MKLATWNVNSLKVRLPQVLEWLQSASPDVLVMQELKQVTEEFAVDAFKGLGYHAVANGQRAYNGVAIVCRSPVSDLVMELPGFDDRQRRVLAGTTDAVRIVNLYVPNGASVGSESYEYKLRWLAALRRFLAD